MHALTQRLLIELPTTDYDTTTRTTMRWRGSARGARLVGISVVSGQPFIWLSSGERQKGVRINPVDTD
jgi:hypothetical protein